MTLADWLRETAAAYRTQPAHRATAGAAHGLLSGAACRAGRLADWTPGVPIWEREWDLCIVLDAMRYDLFVQACMQYDWLPTPRRAVVGPSAARDEYVPSIQSVGTQSPEWIHHTFDARHGPVRRRAAYVTGNPFSGAQESVWPNLPLEEGTDVGLLAEPWKTEWVQDDEEWGISTIPPEPVTEATLDVWHRREELGVDRVVAHYMQPHAPFRSRPEWFPLTRELQGWGIPAEGEPPKDVWHKLRDGTVAHNDVWRAYRDNLDWGLSAVERVRQHVGEGVTIALTSDHGNAVGEWGVYSHPPGSPLGCLRTVPFVTISGTGEREWVAGSVETGATTAASAPADVDERLAALGYG